MAITDKDIKKLSGIFGTKEELGQFKNEVANRFDRVDKDFRQLRNDVATGFDKVMGELEKAREDRVFAKAT